MGPDPQIVETIRRVANKYGIDPATALAIAERESSFNVRGGSGSRLSSAYGLFQLLKSERAQYGGNSLDPEEQSEAWANYIEPHRQHLTKVLGREPSGSELYFSHLIGPDRAARIVAGQIHPDTPIQDVMTPKELAANPFMVRAGTAGNLAGSVMRDIDRRRAKYGGEAEAGTDMASAAPMGQPPTSKGFDFAKYGELVEQPTDSGAQQSAYPSALGTKSTPSVFSQYGELVQSVADRGESKSPDRLDFTGKNNTSLSAGEEAKFQDWAAKQSKVTGRSTTNDLYNYDLRGFWKANPDFSYADKNQHLTDTYKKPNHPTFSTGSQYHGQEGNEGGQWKDLGNDKWSFTPGSTNMQMHGAGGLKDYFGRVEKGNRLEFPQGKKMGLGYDPNLDEMGSGYNPDSAATVQGADQGLVRQPTMPNGADAGMEINPAKVPKQPLSQVPQNELDDNRPDFYQRQFPASLPASPSGFSQFGEPVGI